MVVRRLVIFMVLETAPIALVNELLPRLAL